MSRVPINKLSNARDNSAVKKQKKRALFFQKTNAEKPREKVLFCTEPKGRTYTSFRCLRGRRLAPAPLRTCDRRGHTSEPRAMPLAIPWRVGSPPRRPWRAALRGSRSALALGHQDTATARPGLLRGGMWLVWCPYPPLPAPETPQAAPVSLLRPLKLLPP